jgi:hypothetical protein
MGRVNVINQFDASMKRIYKARRQRYNALIASGKSIDEAIRGAIYVSG